MPRAKRKTSKAKKTSAEKAEAILKKHPEWRENRPVPLGTKKEILKDALKRPLTKEEVDKIEQAMFDKKHRGNKPDLEVVIKAWETAIADDNKVKFRTIKDENGNVVKQEAIVDYRRKQQSHILKIVQITPPILSDRQSVIDAVRQYFAVCLEDGVAYSVNGLALALGTTRENLKRWVNGEVRLENKDIIEQAYEMVALQTELDIREGKGNPVGQIFLGKNDSGYVDEVKHTINKSKIDDIDEKELAEKYLGIGEKKK